MTVPQINIRLTTPVKAAFDAYAGELGLAASELAKLLIVRERHQNRLATLRAGAARTTELRPAGEPARRMSKVTAHVSSVEEVRDFDAHARECGLDRSGAGALLLETELRERWLENAIMAP